MTTLKSRYNRYSSESLTKQQESPYPTRCVYMSEALE